MKLPTLTFTDYEGRVYTITNCPELPKMESGATGTAQPTLLPPSLVGYQPSGLGLTDGLHGLHLLERLDS